MKAIYRKLLYLYPTTHQISDPHSSPYED